MPPTIMSPPAASGDAYVCGQTFSPVKSTSIVGTGLKTEFESSRPYSQSTFAPTRWRLVIFVLLSIFYPMRLTSQVMSRLQNNGACYLKAHYWSAWVSVWKHDSLTPPNLIPFIAIGLQNQREGNA